MRVTMEDITKAGYCAAGASRWFQRHGIDFAAFLKDGMDADEFQERGDYLARKVVEKKVARDG